MQELRYGKFLKAFIYTFCPALIALFVWALLQINSQNAVVYFVVIVPISVAMIALAVYALVDVTIGKFTIADDRVTLHTMFGSRSLLAQDIRGFRQDENYIRIIPLKEFQKEIKVSRYLKNSNLVIEWLATHYNDLDICEGDEEERQVLQNDEFGITEESRLQRLNKARKVSRVINAGAWGLLIWLFAIPEYYTYGMIVCSLYPLIAIFAMLFYRGLISPDSYENSKIPSVGIAFLVPGVVLALRVLIDFTILEHPRSLWVAVVCVSIGLSLSYMLPSFRLNTKPIRFYLTGLLLIFLNLFYGYGVIIAANCMLDNSQPRKYKTSVAEKRVSDGKTTTYYVGLNPWGTLTELQEAKVSREEYESTHVGDKVVVTQHAGYLAIPWIEIKLLTNGKRFPS